jgi:hypothetical protein
LGLPGHEKGGDHLIVRAAKQVSGRACKTANFSAAVCLANFEVG